MNKRSLWLGLSLLIGPWGMAQAMPFGTFDPRSMAMGGTGVASGTSANAAFFNPALLAIAPKGEDFSIELPILSVRLADQDEFIDRLDTFQGSNAIDNFSNAITAFNAATPPAQVSTAKDLVVSTGNTLITGLGTLSNRNLEMEIMAGAAVGIPSKKFAVSVFVAGRAMGGMVLDITRDDLGDIQGILNQLAANNLAPIIDPTPTMTSAMLGRGAVISEVGIAFAKEFKFGSSVASCMICRIYCVNLSPSFPRRRGFSDETLQGDTAG